MLRGQQKNHPETENIRQIDYFNKSPHDGLIQ